MLIIGIRVLFFARLGVLWLESNFSLMNFKYSILTIVAAFVCLSTSCRTKGPDYYDTSKLTTYDVAIKDSFDAISVANNIDVEYTVGSSVSLSMSTPSDNHDNVVIKVERNTLVMKVENRDKGFKLNMSAKPVKVKLKAPAVSTITAVNNSEVDINGVYDKNVLSITATNNAEVTFNNKTIVQEATFTATNNAEITLGQVEGGTISATATNNAEIEFSNLNATNLTGTATNNADLSVRGQGGTAILNATNNAEISAGSFVVKDAVCTATNLAEITVNATSLSSTTKNKGTIKNKH